MLRCLPSVLRFSCVASRELDYLPAFFEDVLRVVGSRDRDCVRSPGCCFVSRRPFCPSSSLHLHFPEHRLNVSYLRVEICPCRVAPPVYIRRERARRGFTRANYTVTRVCVRSLASVEEVPFILVNWCRLVLSLSPAESRLAFLKEFVKDLQRNPPPPPVDPPPVPSTEVLRAGAGAESSPVSSAPHSPAGNLSEGSEPLRSRLPVSSPAQPDEPVQESGTREPEGPSDPRSSVAEPSETSKKETMNAEAEKETDSADGVAGFIESYAVVFLAIGGLLLSVLLLRRFCVKTPEGAVNDAGGWRTSPVEESSGGKREGEGVRDGMVGPNKRPHAKKEGYSQVVVNAGQEQYSDDESGF